MAVGVVGGISVHKENQQARQTKSFYSISSDIPTTSLAEFKNTGLMYGDDYLSQVRSLLDFSNRTDTTESDQGHSTDSDDVSFLQVESQARAQTETKRVQSFCEICILVMQMKERGQPHLCFGLNDNYYVTCVEILISLLRADKALVYWLKNGCMHLDSTGPEIVRPCPALNICSWVPNLFSQPPSLVKDGVEALCPKDNKFLPTIPQEYKNLLDQSSATGSTTQAPGATQAPPGATQKVF